MGKTRSFFRYISIALCLMVTFHLAPVSAHAAVLPDASDKKIEEIDTSGTDENVPYFTAQYAGARVVLTSYSILEGDFLADNQITIRLTLKNRSGAWNARGVLITYEVEKNALVPAYGSSNQIYFPVIEAGQSVEYDMVLNIDNTVSVGSYLISFAAQYVDGLVGRVETKFYIGMIAGQIFGQTLDSVQLLGMQTTGPVGQDGQTSVWLSVANTSSQEYSNAVLLVASALEATPQQVPLGSLEPNANLQKEVQLTLPDQSVQQVYISFMYEDENGFRYTTNKFVQTLYRYQSETSPTQTSRSLSEVLRLYADQIILYCILIALVIGLLILLQLRKRKRQVK